MSDILRLINKPNDIKTIPPKDWRELASQIRRLILESVSKNGGHLASNLGVVELTMALHIFLDFPEDKLIWDVGHQSYAHKILTGRKDAFSTLRQYNGLCGFPKHVESDCDCFDTGHSSTSISAACGFVKARDLAGDDYKVVAVIGDGSLSGGMAFEALNNASRIKSNMIIVLNDNEMSISKNVGGMSRYLAKIRTNSGYRDFKKSIEDFLNTIPVAGPKIVTKLKRSKNSIKQLFVPGMLFENMGITYIGPIDGHNISYMLQAFEAASQSDGPVLVHVVTKKGKGYSLAQKHPAKYHGVGAFDIGTGKPVRKSRTSYTDVFGKAVYNYAKGDTKVVAVCAAMADGTGLTDFAKEYRDRFFDVGIAEEHAVTFAAGLAAQGFIPFVAIYSTFLQRAYDQIVHDVCKNRLHVIFAIDRAGIVGQDGETHQGIFDVSYLTHIPQMVLMAPKNGKELEQMLDFALAYDGPVAIRYPRGEASVALEDMNKEIELGKSETIEENGSDVVFFALGSMVETAAEVSGRLKEQGIASTVVNMRFAAPLDREVLTKFAAGAGLVVTMEENIKRGGMGQAIAAYLMEEGIETGGFLNISLPDSYLSQGKPDELKRADHMDADGVYERVIQAVRSV